MLQRSGGSIHYEVSGRNHAPALVLLHPLGASLGTWQPQLAECERFFRVIRIDLRGHGKSRLDEGPTGSCSMADLAADALAVLDALHIERAHWCGVSIGGVIALQVAVMAPRRVGRLVLANTAACFPPAEAWDERIETARSHGLEPLQASVPERWFSAAFREREAATVAGIVDLFATTQVRGYIEACSALRDVDLMARLGEVQAPTLVVAGARDNPDSIERAGQLADGIVGADLLMLDAAHLSNVEQAEDFTTAVVDFLRD
jgi:3-oxoadipate enol-lactonase